MRAEPWWCRPAVVMAALTGLGLMVDSLLHTSATYDEVAYLRIAARWWRTGDQTEITRMGSPLTFWKLQQVPVLWAIDRAGFTEFVDRPIEHQQALLPLVRLGGLWIWLVALLVTTAWSRALYGPRAMALAAWLFALSPNILAHGALATMELPLVAATTGVFFLFWKFLRGDGRRYFWASAALAGVAWSCKFTTVLVPPILAVVWWAERWRDGQRRWLRLTAEVGLGILGFSAAMLAANFVVTGFALIPLSHAPGEHPSLAGRFGPTVQKWVSRAIELPMPCDWVGFATQVVHQRSGGSSYLLGARQATGWRHYYLVALAVKVPLSFWLFAVARARLRRRGPFDSMLPLVIALFLIITSLGSSRNYGVRYLLPLAPLAIVWVSALAEASREMRTLACVGLLGQAVAVASIHPYELTYFNVAAGGPRGGRAILADSNLDWGQGLKALARLQRAHPDYQDMSFYYFGDTDPRHYGVDGRCYVVDAGEDHPDLPRQVDVRSKYLAVSASLKWGPWGPKGYFQSLDGIRPVRETDDHTILIYRAADVPQPR
ncbi:MAG: glycosyltransferase family 39 protein [Isosphaeraceae bacterium]|nr:glycosyltransferase family 39 protein [Isosphaeraceae bacterium]